MRPPRYCCHSPVTLRTARHRRNSAFSLVEVTLALGVMSFAVISLLGLLSTGFGNSQQSQRRDAKSEIAREILGTIQLSRFQLLPQFHNSNYYYDGEGKPLSAGDSGIAFRAQSLLAPPQNQVDFNPRQTVATNVVVNVWAVAEPKLTNRTVRLIVAGD